MSTVEEALLALFGKSDDGSAQKDAGVNKRDASLGRRLVKKVQKGEDLTHKESVSAYRMLRKYKKQLKDNGIDYEDIDEPEGDEDPRQMEIEAELRDLEQYRSKALEIAEKGDPLGFFLDAFNCIHIGDREAAEIQFIAFGCQAASTSQGLQVVWTGLSGKGKSAGVDACYHFLPMLYVLKGSITAKSLFAHKDLPDGACIFLDDIKVEEGTDLESTIKRSTSTFQEGAYHEFLDGNRTLQTMRLPRRLCWSLTYIDVTESGDQFLNRMFAVKTDSSREVDDSVCRHVLRQAELGEVALPRTEPVMICKALFLDIKNRPPYRVIVPNISAVVSFTERHNRRNTSLFIDLVIGLACLRHRQRRKEQNEHGDWILYAEMNDIREAARIFNASGEFLGSRLDEDERAAALMLAQAGDEGLTVKDLLEGLRSKFPNEGWNERKTRRLLLGLQERDNGNGGLISKLQGIYSEEIPQSHGRPKKVYKLSPGVSPIDFFGLQVVLNESDELSSPSSPILPRAAGDDETDCKRSTDHTYSPSSPEKEQEDELNREESKIQTPSLGSGEKGNLGKKIPQNESIDSRISCTGSMGKRWGESGEKELIGIGPHPRRDMPTPVYGKKRGATEVEPLVASSERQGRHSNEDSTKDVAQLVKRAVMHLEGEGRPVTAAAIADELGLSNKLSVVVSQLKEEGYEMTNEVDPSSHHIILRPVRLDRERLMLNDGKKPEASDKEGDEGFAGELI